MMEYLYRHFIQRPNLRRIVTRLIEGNRDLDIGLLGTVIRVNSIKEHGYLRASRKARTSSLLSDELPVIINLAALLSDGDTFIDIGANVGIYSLTLARMNRMFLNIIFYAFEANPDTFSRLAVHTESLGVRAQNLAISDRNGSLDFVSGAVSHVFTTVENATECSDMSVRCTVPCRRLDSIDIEGDSLVLKIDVEGQEKNVLDGALALFRAGRIKAVYLDGYKDREIEGFLRQQEFTLFDGRTLEPASRCVYSLLAIRAAPDRGAARP
jgi:FkbM family methyltransferase